MTTDYIPRGDWRFEDGPQGPRVVIPTRCFWPVMLFMGAWLAAWAVGELSAIRGLLGPNPWFAKLFLLVWLSGWTLSGALVGAIFIATSGLFREVLWRDGRQFFRRWEGLGLYWTLRHEVSAMGPIAPAKDAGGLRFDYAGKEIIIGLGLDEGQTARLLELLRERFRLKTKSRD
ncbi:MAG: hypothetical protein HYZ75_03175 [Elusimicrobia bacterium]|nr:hypothetical protein [Elusimicrobiota bacterium]